MLKIKRNILHKKYENEFIKWIGKNTLPIQGKWEVIRWKSNREKATKIIFDDDKESEYFTCNDAAIKETLIFVEKKNNSRRWQCQKKKKSIGQLSQ